MTKSPFTRKDEPVSKVLDLIYSNVCGPMNISARGGYSYFIIFIDNLSRYRYIYLMKHKFELLKYSNNSVMK